MYSFDKKLKDGEVEVEWPTQTRFWLEWLSGPLKPGLGLSGDVEHWSNSADTISTDPHNEPGVLPATRYSRREIRTECGEGGMG